MSTAVRQPLSWAASRLDMTFVVTRAGGRAALAAYLPVGFPTFSQSLDALCALSEHADVLELGLPHRTPALDGPVIQAASAEALADGFRIRDLFLACRVLSAGSSADLVVMTYWQPVSLYGPERFAQELTDAGAAGVVLPDLPLEAAGPWLAAARANGLHTVFVAAPRASDIQLARVGAAGSGMIYAPATPGVTGSTGPLHPDLSGFVERLRGLTALPVGVGIGVSSADQAHAVSEYSDAVIVGSALVRRIQETRGRRGIQAAAAFASDLSAAVVRTAASRPADADRSPARCAHRSLSGSLGKVDAL